jgi:DNA end-binding protein Ku
VTTEAVARAIWTGSISFGLVNVPVRMYSAVSEHDVHFHLLHTKDDSRIGYEKICKEEGRPVPDDEIQKAYEVAPGEYVYVTDEDLAAAEGETYKTIELEDFVPHQEIDPIYFERTYYLGPAAGAEKVYALLREAMEQSGLSGIGKYVMRDKQHLGCLRVRDGVIVLERMYFADEVRPADEVEVGDASVGKRELEMARQLIDRFAGPFEPEKYEDTSQKRLLEIIEAKRKGEEVHVEPRRDDETPTDLMEALRASVKAAQTRRSAGRNGGRGSGDGLSELSKAELEKRAKKAGVRGYSKMKKDELVEALEDA